MSVKTALNSRADLLRWAHYCKKQDLQAEELKNIAFLLGYQAVEKEPETKMQEEIQDTPAKDKPETKKNTETQGNLSKGMHCNMQHPPGYT